MDKVFFGGFYFPKELFQKNMETFKEGLAHSSLACEEMFEQLYEYEDKLENLMLRDSKTIYDTLSLEEQNKIRNKIRYFVLYSAKYMGAISEDIAENDVETINRLYLQKYSYFENWIYNVLVFVDGKWDERKTYSKVVELFRLLPQY